MLFTITWPRWVAQYNWQCTYGKHYDVWQADGQSSVSGITKDVDVNFDFTGPLVHGDQWVYSNGSWWYHYKDGSYPKNGWAQIDGKWYYFYADGSMAVSTKVDGYEVGADGARR